MWHRYILGLSGLGLPCNCSYFDRDHTDLEYANVMADIGEKYARELMEKLPHE